MYKIKYMLQSEYKPGKRHWLKVKKDYLMDGAMADTADLIVLGAWYGTGQKGNNSLQEIILFTHKYQVFS